MVHDRQFMSKKPKNIYMESSVVLAIVARFSRVHRFILRMPGQA